MKPNIMMILVDDLGYGDISCYGGPETQTPSVDRIAVEGMRFKQFYANSPVCSPSRASLLTGRFPDLVGVPGVIRQSIHDSWGYFDPKAVTLPDMLRKGGYKTIHIGKWHLGLEDENHPCERGFGLYRGFIDDMMDDYWTHLRFGNNGMRHNKEIIDPEGHATDLFTQWAIEEIEACKGDDQPWFMYLAYNAPHTPIQPPDEWVEKVKRRQPELSEKRAKYIALVEHLDYGIGQVLDALKALGQEQDTLVVFSSDNGGWLPAGAYNGTLRGGKLDMYEGGIRVPCCIKWPGKIEAGKETDQMAMLMDLFPTFCEAAEVPVEHEIEGRSFLPHLTGGEVDFSERYYYWVRREGWGPRDLSYLGQDYHAARHGNIKLLHNNAFAPLEMFDIEADPREQSGMEIDNKGDQHTKDLIKFMQEQVRLAGAVPWQKRQGRKTEV